MSATRKVVHQSDANIPEKNPLTTVEETLQHASPSTKDVTMPYESFNASSTRSTQYNFYSHEESLHQVHRYSMHHNTISISTLIINFILC